jgi:hypothetical protein
MGVLKCDLDMGQGVEEPWEIEGSKTKYSLQTVEALKK